ncbi:YicC family protein [Thermodesulfovibrionales bacterium]|nr:YicC family protein [Thermodesulfovibrionales bacterium]
MTGFGAAEVDGFKAEVRSLNHKYIDISIKMQTVFMRHEIPIRNLIKERFTRGKFDVIVSLTDRKKQRIRIDKEAAKEFYNAFLDLQRDLSVPGSLNIDFFSGYRELLFTEDSEYNVDTLFHAFRDAISKVEEMRKHEGTILAKELTGRLKTLKEIHGEIEELSSGMPQKLKEAISKRANEIASDLVFDESRLEQEIALMAQKSDVTEEIERFRSHLQQFDSFLLSGDAVGRRLDFLLQEMNREANTIAAKAGGTKIIKLTIEIKNEIERLREQVQNIQ